MRRRDEPEPELNLHEPVYCDCPETWLIEYAGYPDSAWHRRVLGQPVANDHHITPEGRIHAWNGKEWLVSPDRQAQN